MLTDLHQCCLQTVKRGFSYHGSYELHIQLIEHYIKTLIVLGLVNVILCFILSKLVPLFVSLLCTYMRFNYHNKTRNQCHKCKLDSFPIFLIVRFGVSVSFWYFGFISVSLVTFKLDVRQHT